MGARVSELFNLESKSTAEFFFFLGGGGEGKMGVGGGWGLE